MAKSDENFKTYIELTSETKEHFRKMVQRFGGSNTIFMTRMTEWFLQQPDEFLSAVQRGDISSTDRLARDWFAKLTAADRPAGEKLPFTVNDSARIMASLTEHLRALAADREAEIIKRLKSSKST